MGALDDADLRLQRAVFLSATGHQAGARQYFEEGKKFAEQVLATEPTNAQAHFILARLFQERQDYSQADAHYRQALQFAPNAINIQEAHSKMLAVWQPVPPAPVPAPPTPAPAIQTARAPVEFSPTPVPEPPPPEPTPDQVEPELTSEAEGYWALGVFKLEQDPPDPIAAEEAFQQALARSPHHIATLKAYSMLLLDRDLYVQAQPYLITLAGLDLAGMEACFAKRSNDTTAMSLALRGIVYAKCNHPAQAEPFLAHALQLEPTRAEWIGEYVAVLLALDREKDALKQLHDAFDAGVDDGLLHREYARLLARQRRYDEVEYHLKRALVLSPNDASTLALRDELQSAMLAFQAALRHMALAKMKIRDGLKDEAEELFEQALEFDGQHLPTLKAYATFLEEEKRFSDAERLWGMVADQAPEEAEAHFRAILDARGENVETLNGLARVMIRLQRVADAESVLRRSLARVPGNVETLELLTDVLIQANRSTEAQTLLGDHLETVKKSAMICARYAELFARKGKYDKAKEFYREAQKLEPTNPRITAICAAAESRIALYDLASREMALGWMEAQMGNVTEAGKSYEKALAIMPDHAQTLDRYAQLLEKTGYAIPASEYIIRLARFDPDAAEEHYRKLLPQMQGQPEGYCAYGYLLCSLQQFDQAVAQFDLALQVQPAYIDALKPYVEILADQGKMPQAEAALKRALEHNPNLAEAHGLLGELLIRRHRYDPAKAQMMQAIELARGQQLDADLARYQEQLDLVNAKRAQIRDAELVWMDARQKENTDPGEAESLFCAARQKCPDDIRILQDYARFLIAQGRSPDALACLKAIQQLDPYDETINHQAAELELVIAAPAAA
jgi:tetratricopeptide (TPR) repeat protein